MIKNLNMKAIDKSNLQSIITKPTLKKTNISKIVGTGTNIDLSKFKNSKPDEDQGIKNQGQSAETNKRFLLNNFKNFGGVAAGGGGSVQQSQ